MKRVLLIYFYQALIQFSAFMSLFALPPLLIQFLEQLSVTLVYIVRCVEVDTRNCTITINYRNNVLDQLIVPPSMQYA